MRRLAEIVLVVLALTGFLAGGSASAAMLPGAAMSAAMPSDCPHASNSAADSGHATHALAAKALALMACCFGTGPGLALAAAGPAARPLPGLRIRPGSDAVPAARVPGLETPPPRA